MIATPLRLLVGCAAAAVAAGMVAAAAGADGSRRPQRLPPPPAYVEECGGCHVAYPARFLGASSWEAVLAGLEQHFGTDASLDPQALAAARAYLVAGARSRDTSADGGPLLRISETAWFRHEHPKPGAALWAHPDVRSPANCGACHRGAEAGDYRERTLRVPKKGAVQ
jgi:hypothetical protein